MHFVEVKNSASSEPQIFRFVHTLRFKFLLGWPRFFSKSFYGKSWSWKKVNILEVGEHAWEGPHERCFITSQWEADFRAAVSVRLVRKSWLNWNWKGKFSVFPLGQKIYNGSKWVQEPQLRALAGTRLKHRSRRIGYHLINESWCNKDRSSLKGVLCKKENISMHSCYFGNRVLICIRWGQKAIVIIIFSQHKQGVIHAYYINILELFRFSVYMYVFSPVTRAQISEASLY